MSDYARLSYLRRYYEAFLNATTGTIAVNVSITNGQPAATLASVSPGLTLGGVYGITATGIPGSTTFTFGGTTAITLSNNATATNAAAASQISDVISTLG